MDPVLPCKGLDGGILPQVLLIHILDVVVEGEYWLGRVEIAFAQRVLNLAITADVLSCVMTCLGRNETKSFARTGRFGPFTKCRSTIFSVSPSGPSDYPVPDAPRGTS